MLQALSPIGQTIETLFRVPSKEGEDMDFKLNPVQRRIDRNWTRRNVIPKARQGGVSTFCVARHVVKCLGMRNRRCVIISHDAEATAKLLDKARYFIDNLKVDPELKADVPRNNRGELHFGKTNSTIYIGTAGSRNFGRGDTITDLHCSELPFWPDAGRLMRGLLQAAKAGEVTIEATGNGVGDYFHRICMRASEGQGYSLHFIPFTEMAEYSLPFETQEERLEFLRHPRDEYEEAGLGSVLTAEQLHWRRMTILDDFEGDLRAFKAEYPLTLEECFQATGYAFFQNYKFMLTPEWKQESRHMQVKLGHPDPGLNYVIGADIAAGVGKDYSVAQVLCLETDEQVATYSNNTIAPDDFGIVLDGLGRRFNLAYINPEQNNHGLTTISELTKTYPSYLIHRTKAHGSPNRDIAGITAFGTQTNEVSRAFMLGEMRRVLKNIILYNPRTKSEIETFVEADNGKIQAMDGCHDDEVMSLGMAVLARERGAIISAGRKPSPQRSEDDPFNVNYMLNEIARRNGTQYDREYPDENYGTL
jgi:hypothetical protein